MTLEGDLVPFHFGTLGDADRQAVEQHLAACPGCLVAYFEVKRAIERNPPSRPSRALEARLRASVMAEVRPRRLRIAPYATVAACVALAVALGVVAHVHTPKAPVVAAHDDDAQTDKTSTPQQQLPPRFAGAVDSARDPNQRLAFY